MQDAVGHVQIQLPVSHAVYLHGTHTMPRPRRAGRVNCDGRLGMPGPVPPVHASAGRPVRVLAGASGESR